MLANDKYILDANGNAVPEPDLHKWGKWIEENRKERIVARTDVGEWFVSTVFLGLDHSFGDGDPVLWETMSFEKKESEGEFNGRKFPYHKEVDGEHTYTRYTSKEDAIKGHELAVKELQSRL